MTEAGRSNAFKTWLVSKLKPALPVPKMVSGIGQLKNMGSIAKDSGCRNVLIVSDEVLEKIGLVGAVEQSLDAAGVRYTVFAKVLPNCPERLVEDGYELYRKNGCDGIIAVGGGSSMDCAKVIGAKVCNPKPIIKYKGNYKVAGFSKALAAKYPTLIAVPTTSGTGSETTVAAVVFMEDRAIKLVLTDAVMIPKIAVLDPEVTVSLPPHITAATGMDALTHATESFLSTWANKDTRLKSLRAVERIGKHLLTCYHEPKNLFAREQMLIASFEAGLAFTNAAVGYVHAIAHTLGAYFHVPHGVANAMLMPYVLDFYVADCVDQFVELAIAIGAVSRYEVLIDDGEKLKAAKSYIKLVRDMNAKMKIPEYVNKMKPEDVRRVVERAMVESHGEGSVLNIGDMGYPVPKYMSYEDVEKVVISVLPPKHARL